MMTPMTLSPDSFTEIVPFMKKKEPTYISQDCPNVSGNDK